MKPTKLDLMNTLISLKESISISEKKVISQYQLGMLIGKHMAYTNILELNFILNKEDRSKITLEY